MRRNTRCKQYNEMLAGSPLDNATTIRIDEVMQMYKKNRSSIEATKTIEYKFSRDINTRKAHYNIYTCAGEGRFEVCCAILNRNPIAAVVCVCGLNVCVCVFVSAYVWACVSD